MATFVIPLRGGEVVADDESSEVRILVDSEELVATWSRYAPGESGPGPHIHREHSDCFWVLEGRLVFEVGSGNRIEAGPGTFVAVPPFVVHTFRNEGPRDAEFLNFHAPGMGFADALRDDAPFDSEDPPADGGRDPAEVVVAPDGSGGTSETHITVAPGARPAGDFAFALPDGRVLSVLAPPA
jgi:mannose-6-phosphate isomerase-like protein (cupin superfamily)